MAPFIHIRSFEDAAKHVAVRVTLRNFWYKVEWRDARGVWHEAGNVRNEPHALDAATTLFNQLCK